MISGLKNFIANNIGASSDYSRPSKDSVGIGIAAGGALLGTGIGALVGASRGVNDVVTIEKVPYAESYQVAVGTHQSSGCYQYHYNFSSGEYEYSYDPLCTETVTDYETRYTGRTLYHDVKHHSVGFPHSALQGALLGFGVGLTAGVAGAVIYNAVSKE